MFQLLRIENVVLVFRRDFGGCNYLPIKSKLVNIRHISDIIIFFEMFVAPFSNSPWGVVLVL